MAFVGRRGVLAGTWGVVSIDNVPIEVNYQGSRMVTAGAVGWLTDDIAVLSAQLLPPIAGVTTLGGGLCIALYDPRTNTLTPVAARGSERGFCGGGVWAVQTVADGIQTSTGWKVHGPSITTVGPDGEIAYAVPPAGFPVMVRPQTGPDYELCDRFCFGAKLLGGGRALLTTDRGLRFIGIPAPVALPENAAWLDMEEIGGVWWCAYQDGYRAVLRRADDSTQGYVYSTPATFGLDLREVDGLAVVAWSFIDGGQPGQQTIIRQDLSEPMVSLLNAPSVPPPSIPKPKHPKPQPPKEPTVSWTPMMPDRSDDVRKLRDRYLDLWNAMNLRDDPRFMKLVASAFHYGHAELGIVADPAFGLNGKRGSRTEISPDVLSYLNPTVNTHMDDQALRCESVDFIGAHGAPNADVVWNNITEELPPRGNGAGARWIQPGRIGAPPAPTPGPTPTPQPPAEVAALKARIAQLEAELAQARQSGRQINENYPLLIETLKAAAVAHGHHSLTPEEFDDVVELVAHLSWRFITKHSTPERVIEEARLRGAGEWREQF